MTTPINIGYLEVHFSGGAANADPAASLGGIMSSVKIPSQTATGIGALTGCSIMYAAGNPLGVGTLSFVASTSMITWSPFGGAPGDAVNLTMDGRYVIRSGLGYLVLDVTFASLPVANTNANTTIANAANALFDDVTGQESFEGDTEYRCYYYKNAHPTTSFLGLDVSVIGPVVTIGSITVGKDPAGVGDGVTTGVAMVAADENTSPGAYTEVSFPTVVPTPALAPGEAIAIWEKRVVPAVRSIIPNPPVVGHIRARAYWA